MCLDVLVAAGPGGPTTHLREEVVDEGLVCLDVSVCRAREREHIQAGQRRTCVLVPRERGLVCLDQWYMPLPGGPTTHLCEIHRAGLLDTARADARKGKTVNNGDTEGQNRQKKKDSTACLRMKYHIPCANRSHPSSR